jgi:hypothetical protein
MSTLRTKFKFKLDELWRRRTEQLRRQVGLADSFRPLGFSRPIRDHLIGELVDLATDLLRLQAKTDFSRIVDGYKRHHLRGWGWKKRSENFVSWVDTIPSKPIVYSFWKNNQCLYTGKGKSPRRLKNYCKTIYLHQADRINVHIIRSPSFLPMAECLAVHCNGPTDNKSKPGKTKWGKACPVCKVHDQIWDDLRKLFI